MHLHLIHEAGHTGPAFVAPDINTMVDDFFCAHAQARITRPADQSPAYITESTAVEN